MPTYLPTYAFITCKHLVTGKNLLFAVFIFVTFKLKIFKSFSCSHLTMCFFTLLKIMVIDDPEIQKILKFWHVSMGSNRFGLSCLGLEADNSEKWKREKKLIITGNIKRLIDIRVFQWIKLKSGPCSERACWGFSVFCHICCPLSNCCVFQRTVYKSLVTV